jgi:hypothetical protein
MWKFNIILHITLLHESIALRTKVKVKRQLFYPAAGCGTTAMRRWR